MTNLKGVRKQTGDVVVGQVEFTEQRQVVEGLWLECLDLVVAEVHLLQVSQVEQGSSSKGHKIVVIQV